VHDPKVRDVTRAEEQLLSVGKPPTLFAAHVRAGSAGVSGAIKGGGVAERMGRRTRSAIDRRAFGPRVRLRIRLRVRLRVRVRVRVRRALSQGPRSFIVSYPSRGQYQRFYGLPLVGRC
jgi:hypothetical protein